MLSASFLVLIFLICWINVHFACSATAFWFLLPGFAGNMSISLDSYWFFGSCFLVSQEECPFLLLLTGFLVPAPWFRRENVHFSGSATAFWILLPDFARNMSISLASYWLFGSCFLISPVKCPFLWLLTGFLDPTSWFRPKNVHFARQATDFHKLFGSCFLIFRKKIHSGFTEKMSTSLARPTYQPVQRSLCFRCTGSRKKREELRNCTEIFSSVIRLCSLFCNSLM